MRHSPLLRQLVSLIVTLLLCLAFPPPSAAQDVVSAVINLSSPISPPIHPNFVGFSLEVPGATLWTGISPTSPKPSFLTLMRQLMLTANQNGPILRIGGNSADESWWNPSSLPHPPHVTYDIQPIDIISVHNAVVALNSSAVFGLNFLRGDNSSWAVLHAQAIDKYAGWERSRLEIGNEVSLGVRAQYHYQSLLSPFPTHFPPLSVDLFKDDLYYENGIRPRNYTFAEYDVEWSTYAADIAAALPSAPKRLFQGATFAARAWYPNISAYASSHASVLSTVSVHTYPSTHCNGHNVTIEQLLGDPDSQTDSSRIAAASLPSSLQKLGIPLQIGEGNSVSCGGMPGVSNVFAAALWVIDDLYNLAAIGVRGFNFHGGGSSTESYTSIVWPSKTSDSARVQPLFYGLQFFAMGTRHWPQIVQVNVTTTENQQVKVHATWDRKRASVMIIHKNLTSNQPALVSLNFPPTSPPISFPVAFVRRLTAPSVREQLNITLAGRTYMGTTDGTMSGEEVVEKVVPTNNTGSAVYVVRVEPLSAVLLEWKLSGEEEGLGTSAMNEGDRRSSVSSVINTLLMVIVLVFVMA